MNFGSLILPSFRLLAEEQQIVINMSALISMDKD